MFVSIPEMLLFILFEKQALEADNFDTIEQEREGYVHTCLFIVSVALMNLL